MCQPVVFFIFYKSVCDFCAYWLILQFICMMEYKITSLIFIDTKRPVILL